MRDLSSNPFIMDKHMTQHSTDTKTKASLRTSQNSLLIIANSKKDKQRQYDEK